MAVALVALDGGWWMGQPASRSENASEASFVEALWAGDLEGAFAYIRAGHDPNMPVAFRQQELTGGRDIMVAPLLIAVANNRDDSVAMLMSVGARLDAPGNRFAVCLANRLGHEDIARLIIRDGGPTASNGTCPAIAASPEAPLRAYVE
jgi:hypothetical protein